MRGLQVGKNIEQVFDISPDNRPVGWKADVSDSSLPTAERISYRDVFAKLESLPPLSQSLDGLLDFIRNDGASAKDLEEVLRYDEVISGRILQMANSAYYGLHGTVSSLSRAIMTMGFSEVVSICLCHLLVDHFDRVDVSTRACRAGLWKTSYVAAKMARELAGGNPWLDREEAYTLGLLHDLGLLVMCLHFHKEFQDIARTARERKISFRQAEVEYGPTHTHIGRWISVRWGLPEIYTQVMTFHHEPKDSPSCQAAVKLIFLADVLARSNESPGLLDADETQEFCGELAISGEEWLKYIEKTSAAHGEADRFWRLLA